MLESEFYLDDGEIPLCPRCQHVVTLSRERDGADADGNRYVMRTYVECPRCDWTPADGFEFGDEEDEEEWPMSNTAVAQSVRAKNRRY